MLQQEKYHCTSVNRTVQFRIKFYSLNITIIRQTTVTVFLLEITSIAHSEGIRRKESLWLEELKGLKMFNG